MISSPGWREVGLDKAGYDACKAHFPTLDADRKTVSPIIVRALIAARTTWQNARAACADSVRPDLAPLQLALDNATQALNAANDGCPRPERMYRP